MAKPLISVIVPIYMIDKYVGICIESIINQTYRNLEIILVDDGSKDRCAEICDLYQTKDKRIKVIHKTNGGLVSARKAGLQHSSGEYITYVDGDDWIGSGFIDGLYTAAITTNADMVCAGFSRELFSKSATFLNALPSGIYEGKSLNDLWKKMISYDSFYKPGISTYVWNKLFKRDILISVQPLVDNRISIGEDGAVTYPALLNCTKVAVIDNVAYHYRQREDSMLKQSSGYSTEAQKLYYLYEYLINWAEKYQKELNLKNQVIDYVLSIALMRSGSRLPHNNYSAFSEDYYDKNIVIYSAGTFGQQLVNRIKETKYCNIVAWLDDDYWEYRRCCLNVDPVEIITALNYDYILIAAVDSQLVDRIKRRLYDLGISKNKILSLVTPKNKEEVLKQFLDVSAIRKEEENNKVGVNSHA